MTYNIAVSDSKFSYPGLSLIKPVNGINTFDGKFTPFTNVTYTATITGGHSIDLYNPGNRKYTENIVWHVYGTITKQDITDNVAFYAITNSYPYIDETILIPANSDQAVNTFDFLTINSIDTANYNMYKFNIYAYDKDYKELSTTYYLSLQIACYGL